MKELETKVTRLQRVYRCRIYREGNMLVEGVAKNRREIGPVFRDLFRTLNKLGYVTPLSNAARKRKHKKGNLTISVMHIWPVKLGTS